MAVRKVKIQNRTGLHARPASVLASKAQAFEAKIKIICDGHEANAKSIMSLMSLAIPSDTEVTIEAEGADAEKALATLVKVINNKFSSEK